jgi:outer membrane protein assembly factor BamD
MRFKILAIFAVSVVMASSCASQFDLVMRSNDVDFKYKAAMAYFNDNKFKKAADVFDNLNLLVQGLPQEDTVNFYHGLANYRFGDFETAEASLAKFIEVYPRSAFINQAKYLRIDCLYKGTYRYELDQTPTRKAMMIISEFMYENPGR